MLKKNVLLLLILILITQSIKSNALERCGNGICEDSESYKLCPEDCVSGARDYYCDMVEDGRCDPDCAQGEIDCKGQKRVKKTEYAKTTSQARDKKSTLRLLASAVVVMALILGAYVLYKKINAQKLDYPYQKSMNNEGGYEYQPYYPRR